MQRWLKLKLMIKTVIFDWKRTLYDPDTGMLIDGALKILESIKNKRITMVLIGKGGDDMEEEADRLGIRKYFFKIVFAQGEKELNTFKKFVSDNAEETIIIGDRVRSELEIGHNLGALTIWVKQGKFASEESENSNQEPTYKVKNLDECQKLLSGLY